MRLILIFLLFSFTLHLSAKTTPLADFAKSRSYYDVKVSPDGKHIAAKAPVDNGTALVIIERKTMQSTAFFEFGDYGHVGEYFWANNERVVFKQFIQGGEQDIRTNTGDIYAANIDGSNYRAIYGYASGARQVGTRINKGKKSELAWGYIIDLLPQEPEHIMVYGKPWAVNTEAPGRLVKVNINTGNVSSLTKLPIEQKQVIVDSKGSPLFFNGRNESGKWVTFAYQNEEWISMADDPIFAKYTPFRLAKDDQTLYLHAKNNTDAFFTFNLQSKTLEPLFNQANFDVEEIEVDNNGHVYAFLVMDGKPQFYYPNENLPMVKLHKRLMSAFGGAVVNVVSQTQDGNELVLKVRSDKNAGDIYLYNIATQKAEFVLSERDWLKAEDMAPRRPITLETRDGVTLHGYLTTHSSAEKPAPLVTLVHGGPFGIRDTWFFDAEAQMLASRGFAVLQVNFRGSGGYGHEFESAAYQKRGSLIQQDIIDATRWGLQLPETTAKACIMGTSFGGYSAAMAPTIEPDLFQCSVAISGPYDLTIQDEIADYADVDSLQAEVMKMYGSDANQLKAISPLYRLERLKAPLLVIHGGADKRVPKKHYELLVEALEERKHPHETLYKFKEGHGFYNETNRAEMYQTVVSFLEKHLR